LSEHRLFNIDAARGEHDRAQFGRETFDFRPIPVGRLRSPARSPASGATGPIRSD